MHSDHRKTFGQIRTFGHRRCISILENGIVLADNPTPYIKIGKDKIDFGKSYNPNLTEMSGLIFPNFYKEYGNIVYRYGSNLKCSFWNKTLDYVGLMPPFCSR